MCFRPPAAGKPVKCPKCGATNPPTLKFCMKCKEDLTAAKKADKQEDSE